MDESGKLRSGINNSTAKPRQVRLLANPLVAVWFACAGWFASGQGIKPDPFQTEIRPLLDQYCVKCHSGAKPKAGLNLATFTNTISIYRESKVWATIASKLQDGDMPPEGKPQPDPSERERVVKRIRSSLQELADGRLRPDPGRVLIHRLSRTEYNCTVRDLFGVDTKPADKFPSEGGGGGGFDNNADTLFIPPILLERYLRAADEIVEQAETENILPFKRRWPASERAYARKILEHFATLGFRRPAETDEVDRFLVVYDNHRRQGQAFETSLRAALKVILVSPNFLFRVERDQNKSGPYRIGEYELATRLSYFLWSSMPDDELRTLARARRLHEPRILEQQIHRMLLDPKAEVLAETFAGQWLRVRELQNAAQPDPQKFPEYTVALRSAMCHEVICFFNSVLREDRSLLDLLNANDTFVNAELAKLYGIEGVQGPEMRQVKLSKPERGGLLGMGAILTLTSYPLRTSPVLRGKWVLEEILGTPPPPPPPIVKSLPQDDSPVDGLSLRQRLEQHRSQPECAVCHVRMDPLGFGLENYDAIGRWRTRIGDQPVDSSGVLPGGEKFEGPSQLKEVLLKRKDDFARTITEKMLAYALGRGLEYYDTPTVNMIVKALAQNNYRSSVLVTEIVKSFPFQFRRNERAQ